MNVIEMVGNQIRLLGGDGLFDEEECGCTLDDLAPCGSIGHSCVIAKNRGTKERWAMFPMSLPNATIQRAGASPAPLQSLVGCEPSTGEAKP